MRITTSDGVPIAVHDLGNRGDPLLLVHATGFHGRVWRPVASLLEGRFHCLSLDQRGHGDSGDPAGLDYDWRGLARDVLAVVDGLRLERPWAAGHSAGSTALLLAEEARPGTFRALYCYEPAVVPADPPLGRDHDSWLAATARRRREVFASAQEAYENYAAKPPLASMDAAVLREYVDHGFEQLPDGRVRLKCRAEHEALIYEMATDHDCFVNLSEVACPVMLAWGGLEEGFGRRSAEPMAERLTGARTEVLPGLGHLGPLEQPADFAHSVGRFFTGLEAPC